MLALQSIAEQLTEIYFKYEPWHKVRLTQEQALKYHQERLDRGNIMTYVRDGEVLGYIEMYIIGNTCFLHNVFIKPEHRFKEVYKYLKSRFFASLPSNIKYIVGEKQKTGKIMTEVIHGNN